MFIFSMRIIKLNKLPIMVWSDIIQTLHTTECFVILVKFPLSNLEFTFHGDNVVNGVLLK